MFHILKYGIEITIFVRIVIVPSVQLTFFFMKLRHDVMNSFLSFAYNFPKK